MHAGCNHNNNNSIHECMYVCMQTAMYINTHTYTHAHSISRTAQRCVLFHLLFPMMGCLRWQNYFVKVFPDKSPELSKFSSFTLGVGQNIALCAWPTTEILPHLFLFFFFVSFLFYSAVCDVSSWINQIIPCDLLNSVLCWYDLSCWLDVKCHVTKSFFFFFWLRGTTCTVCCCLFWFKESWTYPIQQASACLCIYCVGLICVKFFCSVPT